MTSLTSARAAVADAPIFSWLTWGSSPRPPAPARRLRWANDVLGARALNRALLHRQLLLRRWRLPAEAAVERLVGMQAQRPDNPYVALWTRLEGFRPEQLSRLVRERRVVRLALMRSTIHLVTARDCLALRPVLQSVQARSLAVGSPYGRRLAGLDLDALVAAGRALVEEEPRTMAELRTKLGERWPDRDPTSLAHAIRNLAPLVQVPPRGLWGEAGQATLTTAEHWLGRTLDAADAPDEMLMRYLAAFGPASVRDMQVWSGLLRLGEVVDRLRPRLRTFHDDRGEELFDLPHAPRPDPDITAPPRFLPEFDNLLLSHADRRRIVSDQARKRLLTPNGASRGTFLVDGFVRGTWRLRRDRRATVLLVEPLDPLSRADRAAVAEETVKLLAFVAQDPRAVDVRFV